MAKIRSTLDIVMERTKDLTLTGEQKTKLHLEEWSQKTRGLIQRFYAGMLSAAGFRAELARGKQECPELETIVKQEFIQTLAPEADYRILTGGLKDVLGIDPAPYIERLQGFAARSAEARHREGERALQGLKQRGVSGTAVLPNLENDPSWQARVAQLGAELKRELLSL